MQLGVSVVQADSEIVTRMLANTYIKVSMCICLKTEFLKYDLVKPA